jgi:hypothetical protein
VLISSSTSRRACSRRYGLDWGAHRLRELRRHQRGIQRHLRPVAARHDGHREQLGHHQCEPVRASRPVAGRGLRNQDRTSRNAAVEGPRLVSLRSASRSTRRSTTSRACTGDRPARASSGPTRFEIKDDFTLSRGAHQLKFGGAHERFISPEDSPPNFGTWTFVTDQFLRRNAAAIARLTAPRTFNGLVPGQRAAPRAVLVQRVRPGRMAAEQAADVQLRRAL